MSRPIVARIRFFHSSTETHVRKTLLFFSRSTSHNASLPGETPCDGIEHAALRRIVRLVLERLPRRAGGVPARPDVPRRPHHGTDRPGGGVEQPPALGQLGEVDQPLGACEETVQAKPSGMPMRLGPVGEEVGPTCLCFDHGRARRPKPDHVRLLSAPDRDHLGGYHAEPFSPHPPRTEIDQLGVRERLHHSARATVDDFIAKRSCACRHHSGSTCSDVPPT
ncbi:hypothetical protein XAC3608_1970012 [Xanthomonas citri pv. citri]|nr:hypothetical protein XAC3608_1970012 [Xanthomonas citri pv. citri]